MGPPVPTVPVKTAAAVTQKPAAVPEKPVPPVAEKSMTEKPAEITTIPEKSGKVQVNKIIEKPVEEIMKKEDPVKGTEKENESIVTKDTKVEESVEINKVDSLKEDVKKSIEEPKKELKTKVANKEPKVVAKKEPKVVAKKEPKVVAKKET